MKGGSGSGSRETADAIEDDVNDDDDVGTADVTGDELISLPGCCFFHFVRRF